MTGQKQGAAAAVSRAYKPELDVCARALALLLKMTTNRKAAEHAPEPDGRNDAREIDGCAATRNYTA